MELPEGDADAGVAFGTNAGNGWRMTLRFWTTPSYGSIATRWRIHDPGGARNQINSSPVPYEYRPRGVHFLHGHAWCMARIFRGPMQWHACNPCSRKGHSSCHGSAGRIRDGGTTLIAVAVDVTVADVVLDVD
eukprot:SAG22_NODE_331_length_12174_cov_12.920497_6_plen_133_part_00